MVKDGDAVKVVDADNIPDLYVGQFGYVAGIQDFGPKQGILAFFQPDDRDSKIYAINPRRLEVVPSDA